MRAYDHALIDLDGCVWVGDEPTSSAVEAIAALRAAGKGISFVTNDARRSAEEFVRKLWRLGFQASLEEVVTVGGALQFHLAQAGRQFATAFVIGADAVIAHVADAGLRIVNNTEFASRADVVVVAAHDELTYGELRIATQAVLRGAPMVCAGRDATFPMPDGAWPGTGSVVAALEYATGVSASTVGKPEGAIFQTALDRLGDGRALVIGDRLDADVAGARAAGLDAALVLSGATTREQADAAPEPRPVAVGDTLAALVLAR